MLNVSKTKELVIDFRQKSSHLPDLVIKGEKVERVLQYKYLGTVLDSNLYFDQNTALIQKKCQSRMYLQQKTWESECKLIRATNVLLCFY